MKIKVFVDAHVFDGKYQGTTTYLKGLYTALVQDSDFEITLVANNLENLKLHFPNPAFKLLQLPASSGIMRLLVHIPNLLKRETYDFAHFQYNLPLKKVCPYINTIHDVLFLDYPHYFPKLYRIIKGITFYNSAKRSDILCTVSNYSKKAIAKHFKLNEQNLFLTPNAVEQLGNVSVNIKEKYSLDKFILYVSRFEPRKNHVLVLKTFVELELYKQGYQLVFIGKKNDVDTKHYNVFFESLAQTIQKFVLHFESISPQELNAFYNSAELFVYPSFAEGFGIPPLEAAVQGCKVLCSNQTAMDDFDFFEPFRFNPNHPDEFKSKLLQLLANSKYPFEQIRAAVLEKYNWNHIAARFGARLKSGI